jgi:chromosome partitioning protein
MPVAAFMSQSYSGRGFLAVPAKIIAFINYKGGVAKTTTTNHVGCSLAQHFGKKVLLVDIDSQTNLTFLCASIEDWDAFKKKTGTIATMYQRFLDRTALDTKRSIWREPVGMTGTQRVANLDLIPCDIDLIGEDLGGSAVGGSFSNLENLKRQSKEYLRERSFLRQVLKQVEHAFVTTF